MPWKECSVVEERLRFVARLLDGEGRLTCATSSESHVKPATKSSTATRSMASRPSPDRSRRPVRYANQLPNQVDSLIVSLKRNKPLGRP